MRLVLVIAISVFISCMTAFAQTGGERKDEGGYILVLSSYSHDNEWGTSVSKFIRREIERQSPRTLVATTYAGLMDRASFLAGHFAMEAAFANGRISEDQEIPAVLVLVGDESWMHYRTMKLSDVWKKIPVVLVGVRPQVMADFSRFYSDKTLSDSLMIPLEKSKDKIPMTAIYNEGNEQYTLWMMHELIPSLTQVVFLSNGSYQDEYSLRTIKETMSIQYPELKLTVIQNTRNRGDSVQKILTALPENTGVLVNTCDIPKDIPVPVFQMSDRKLEGTAVVGGYYPSNEDYAMQATAAILHVYEGESSDSIRFAPIYGTIPYLNQRAIDRWKLSGSTATITGAVYVNVPPHFIIRHLRTLFLLSLVVVILIIIAFLSVRDRIFRKHITESFERYRDIYNEYQVVYENMPMGLIVFDSKGNVLNRNPESDFFFEKIPAEERADFNILTTTMIDELSQLKIRKRQLVNKVFGYDRQSFHIIFRYIIDPDIRRVNILMIVIDNTEMQRAKDAKERIFNIFNFAMDSSSLGVAEYNLMTKTGFATDTWFRNLAIERTSDVRTNVYRHVIDEDRKKIEDFLANVGEDGEVYFMETIRVNDKGKIHWLQYIIQLLEYGPDEGRIILAEMVLNIDKHKYREEELATALQNAKESDRLKNAFIANMSSDIRPSLEELVVFSNRLIETKDEDEKFELMARIEEHNTLLLQYVERIIELSRTGTVK